MKNTLLKSTLAIAAVFGMASAANAEIDNPAGAKAGEIYRYEANGSDYEQLLNPSDGIYITQTHANDANDWDSQFFIVFADAVVSAGTPISISFEYKKEGDPVQFGAQGHGDPHSYVNNDGWQALDATDDWQEFSTDIEATGEIRTLAVNASIARAQGGEAPLMLRNIVVEVNYEEVINTASGSAVDEVAAVNAFVAGNVLYASEAANIVVYNINGVAVLSASNATSLDLANLNAGLYIAKVGDKAIKFAK